VLCTGPSRQIGPAFSYQLKREGRPETGDLTITELDADLQPVSTLRMSDPDREENFPVE
jgi:hypothetical protein